MNLLIILFLLIILAIVLFLILENLPTHLEKCPRCGNKKILENKGYKRYYIFCSDFECSAEASGRDKEDACYNWNHKRLD